MCRGSRGRRDDEEIPKRMSPPLLSSGYSRLISHWTKRWWCGLLPPQMTTPWCCVLGFIWRQHTEYDTHESSCASPSNATPGVRPLGRTPRISSTATAFLWLQWPDPSAAFKYGQGLYPRQAIGRSATDWLKSYRDHAQIIYLLSPNNQWPAINWQQFIHWLGSRNKQVPARHSYSRYEYKELFNDIFYMIRSGRQEYDNSRSQIETPCGETTWGPHSCLTKETYSIIPNTNDYNFWRHCNPLSNLRMACGFLNMVSIMSQAISSIGELITY